MRILFWLLVSAAAYSYFVYPLCLLALQRIRRGRHMPDALHDALPRISLIITVYNEERRIRDKIEDSLAIDYPSDKLEIIVASDGSTDSTEQIAAEYAGRGVRVVRAPERLGKENAQLHAIRATDGEILVFSDVATRIPPDALGRMARYFSAPDVGAVSSEDRFIARNGEVAGEGAYVRYEMWLRHLESRLAGLVGLSGSFFAARRSVCADWDIHSPSDFNTALSCARSGLRAVSAPDVLGYYQDIKDQGKEYQRKVRTVLRGMTAIARHPDVLNPLRFGLFAWQVWSHKLMRWLVPCFLVGLLVTSLHLSSQGGVYLMALLAQLAFYGLALLAHLVPAFRQLAAPRLVYFFVQVNIGIADAMLRFIAGRRMTTWQPSAR